MGAEPSFTATAITAATATATAVATLRDGTPTSVTRRKHRHHHHHQQQQQQQAQTSPISRSSRRRSRSVPAGMGHSNCMLTCGAPRGVENEAEYVKVGKPWPSHPLAVPLMSGQLPGRPSRAGEGGPADLPLATDYTATRLPTMAGGFRPGEGTPVRTAWSLRVVPPSPATAGSATPAGPGGSSKAALPQRRDAPPALARTTSAASPRAARTAALAAREKLAEWRPPTRGRSAAPSRSAAADTKQQSSLSQPPPRRPLSRSLARPPSRPPFSTARATPPAPKPPRRAITPPSRQFKAVATTKLTVFDRLAVSTAASRARVVPRSGGGGGGGGTAGRAAKPAAKPSAAAKPPAAAVHSRSPPPLTRFRIWEQRGYAAYEAARLIQQSSSPPPPGMDEELCSIRHELNVVFDEMRQRRRDDAVDAGLKRVAAMLRRMLQAIEDVGVGKGDGLAGIRELVDKVADSQLGRR